MTPNKPLSPSNIKQPVTRQVNASTSNCVIVKFMITDDYAHNPTTSCCDPPPMYNHYLCQYGPWPNDRRPLNGS